MHRFLVYSLLLFACLIFSFGLAHHGWSSYQQDELLTFTGVVLEVHFENPHSEIMLELLNEAGELTGEVWEVVLPPPSRATRLGLTAETLLVGMTVTVEGHAHRSIEREMRASSILLDIDAEIIALR